MPAPEILAALAASLAIQNMPGREMAEKPAAAGQDPIVVTGEKQKPDPTKKVCRRTVETGSIMPKVTCRAVRDWEALTEQSVQLAERLKEERRRRQHLQDSVSNQ